MPSHLAQIDSNRNRIGKRMKNISAKTLAVIVKKSAILPNGRTVEKGDFLLVDPDRQPKPGEIYMTKFGEVLVADAPVTDTQGVVVGKQERF
jgi:hypothetical protein